MKRYLIILILIIANKLICWAQLFPEDMLRFSQQYPWGTARSMSMSGAFGALGGDLSSFSINPAGIGVYRSSEFAFSPSLGFNNAGTMFGQSVNSYSNQGNLSNIGFVSSYINNKTDGWIGINFGVSYNRTNDFYRTVTMQRNDAASSLLDQFDFNAYNNIANNGLNSFYEGLGIQTGALYSNTNGDSVFSYYTKSRQHSEFQQETRNISGGMGEWAFSLGSNYNNTLYLGFTIGIDELNYHEDDPLYEQAPSGVQNLSSFTFTQHFNVVGDGVNFKLGAIYKPVNWIRIGAAIHTPTSWNLHSDYNTSMVTLDKDGNGSAASSGVLAFNNSLNTPWKAVFSAAILFSQYGLISIDDEILNYRNMNISGDFVSSQNDSVGSMYKTVNNCRIGAEGRLGQLSLRVGYGFYASPYASDQLNHNTTYQSYSAGFGVRSTHCYLDFAYFLLKYPEHYTLYNYNEVYNNNGTISWINNPISNTAKTEYNINQIVMTLGFKF